MTALPIAGGALLVALALLVIVFLVVAPPAPRVPLERRRAPGTVETSRLTRATDFTVGAIDGVMSRSRRSAFGVEPLEQAGIKMGPSSFILMVVCAGAVLAALGFLVAGFSLWTIPVIIFFSAMAPAGAKILLAVRSSRRRARFADQLDDALTLLAGSLRAGHSLLRAIDAVSHEIQSPTSEEFARVVNETRIGRDLGDALDNTARRMRSEDFRWVAQAIAINREVGGSLSDVFDEVGHTIRERNQIRRQVTALSGEGRLSAFVLIALPIGVFAFLLITQPGYISGFLTNAFGIIALLAAVVLLILGSLWLMVVVRVKF